MNIQASAYSSIASNVADNVEDVQLSAILLAVLGYFEGEIIKFNQIIKFNTDLGLLCRLILYK